ncbi:MAG TPA: C2 family cysteine protease [Kofleriaceae bacterium]
MKRFGANPLLKPSLLQSITQDAWAAYVTAVTPYFKIDDNDHERQFATFYTVYSRSKSLSSAYQGEFTEKQRTLAAAINGQLDREKIELYQSSTGHYEPWFAPSLTMQSDPEILEKHRDTSRHELMEDPHHAPLFTALPDIDDVRQGYLGDCYLLAAVASIVQIDPSHFVRNMVDNVDGTVTVKLYADVGQAFEIAIAKSIVIGEGSTRYARNSLWVQILEKAYASSGLQKENKDRKRKNNEPRNDSPPSYQDIAGGDPGDALLHLTGKPPSSFDLGTSRARFGHEAPVRLQQAGEHIKKQIQQLEDEETLLKKQIEHKREQQVDVTTDESRLKRIGEEIEGLVQQLVEMDEPILDLSNRLKLVFVSDTSLQALVRKHPNNEPLKQLVQQANSMQLLPGEIGSGRYGTDESEAFKRIKSGIDRNRSMCASTRDTISDSENEEENKKGMCGESKVKGLAGKHAYSLLDYKPRPDPKPGEQILIKLRNPWGHYGRTYEKIDGKLKPVAFEGNGVFWIDLADLTANFSSIEWTEQPPPPRPRREVETLKGSFYNDTRSDFRRAILEIAEDADLGDWGDELCDAIERGLPFESRDAMLRVVLSLIPKRPNFAERLVDYLVQASVS